MPESKYLIAAEKIVKILDESTGSYSADAAEHKNIVVAIAKVVQVISETING